MATKLEDYVLNAFHPEGKHKARVFESALGIGLWNREVLSRALLQIARDSNEFLQVADKDHGNTYVLRFRLATEKGHATVLSAWIIRHNEDFPRLTTCYII